MQDFLAELLAWVMIALFCGALLLAVRLSLGHTLRPLLPVQRHRAVPWTGAEILLALFLVLLFWPTVFEQVLIQIHFFSWLYGPDFPLSPTIEDPVAIARRGLWVGAFALPCDVVTILVLLRAGSGTRAYQLGLACRRAAADIACGCIGWLIVTPVVLVLNLIATVCYELISGSEAHPHPLTLLMSNGALPVEWAVAVYTAVIAAPVLEELVFRGMIQFWLARQPWAANVAVAGAFALAALRWAAQGPGPALFVVAMLPGYLFIEPLSRKWLPDPRTARALYSTALLFAASHSFAWPTPIALFVLGLGLGYVAHRSQSLIGPIVWHGLFNGMTCLALALS
ncbi:MAG TPA: CPBP family glutamic-type intramembrane protease [Gemmataceae bacterium]|nr:CPBP family glutamic-type intramembrane protease [Gemmataceae bacterium]